MTIDVEILNKIVVNWVQEHIIYQIKLLSIPGMQNAFNISKSINAVHHMSSLKNRNDMIDQKIELGIRGWLNRGFSEEVSPLWKM